MSTHSVAVIAATAVPIILVGVLIWLLSSVLPRQRRSYSLHPERRPYGRKLLLRMTPFIALGLVALVGGILTRSVSSIVLGGFVLVAFAVGLRQRWNRPSA